MVVGLVRASSLHAEEKSWKEDTVLISPQGTQTIVRPLEADNILFRNSDPQVAKEWGMANARTAVGEVVSIGEPQKLTAEGVGSGYGRFTKQPFGRTVSLDIKQKTILADAAGATLRVDVPELPDELPRFTVKATVEVTMKDGSKEEYSKEVEIDVRSADADARTSAKNTKGAPEMIIKSRKLEFKGVPGSRDWVARGSLTKSGHRWVFAYVDGYKHGRSVPRLIQLRFSDDEGRTWSKVNMLPDGTPVKGAPLQTDEPNRIEICEGVILTCPNKDLLFIGRTFDHRPEPGQFADGTTQFRSTDGGASWTNEGSLLKAPAAVMSLGRAVAGEAIFISVMDRQTEGINDPLYNCLYRSDDNGKSWKRVSTYGGPRDGINETGVVYAGNNTLMVVCRTSSEKSTKMRISRDMGVSWEPFVDITDQVHVVQQPKLQTLDGEPGRIHLTGRDRVEEYSQRNCLWHTDDLGRSWTMFPLDEKFFTDSGYGEVMKRKGGDLYYIGYRGTDDAADIWSYIVSPVKDKRNGDSHQVQRPLR
ncbi:MAG: sialidase family protein [Planctomycetota bacterium]